MGRHSLIVDRSYRGRHRAPSETGKYVARVAITGAFAAVPATAIAPAALATETTMRMDRVSYTVPAQSGGFDRDAIIKCESGGDARAQNATSSASGLYQFIDSTWRAYRGGSNAARAKDASVAEQHAAAARLFAAEGYTPWNASKSCWGSKIGSGSSVTIRDNAPAPKRQESPRATQQSAPAPKVEKKSTAPKKQTAPKQKSKSVAGKYTVRSGDTLGKIATDFYGDKSQWRKLYEKNRDVVGSNPHLIFPGQELVK